LSTVIACPNKILTNNTNVNVNIQMV